MTITRINVNIINEGALVAVCSFVIGNFLKVKNVRIIRRVDGHLIVAMPSVKNSVDEFMDVVFPIDKGSRHELERAILPRVKQQLQEHERTRPQQGH